MPEELTKLDSPIDIMYPIHKALRAEAARAEAAVRGLQPGGACQDLVAGMTRWAQALEYHAVMEDAYMTTPLDRPAARANEAEHQQLTSLLLDLLAAVREAATHEAATARTLRHLLGHVVALRVAQDDHLEEEEERVLPIIRQHVSEAQQWEVVQRLLIDQQAAHPEWVCDWLQPHLTPTEASLLTMILGRERERVA